MEKATQFEWRPGNGPDPSAIENLIKHFGTKPYSPPGEAWFVSEERKMFWDFVDDRVERVSVETFKNFFSR